LRRDGYAVAVAERWIPQAGIRKDLFGFADIVAIKAGEPILAVQATSADNVAARLTKARSLPELRTWLQAGGRFEVWGWRKIGERWHCRKVAAQAADLASIEVQALPRRRRLRRRERQRGLFDEAECPLPSDRD
jgi:hypothetical protein